MSKSRISAPSTLAESRTIPAGVFKATCLELMDDIAATGSEIVVTKHGRPVVRVGPVNTEPTSPMGFMRGTIVRHGDLLSPDSASWAASTTDPLSARSR